MFDLPLRSDDSGVCMHPRFPHRTKAQHIPFRSFHCVVIEHLSTCFTLILFFFFFRIPDVNFVWTNWWRCAEEWTATLNLASNSLSCRFLSWLAYIIVSIHSNGISFFLHIYIQMGKGKKWSPITALTTPLPAWFKWGKRARTIGYN